LFFLPTGYKIYYGHSKYEPKRDGGRLLREFVWPSENRRSEANDHEKNQEGKKETSITRPRLDGGVIKEEEDGRKKKGITRPRPAGGVKSGYYHTPS